MTQKQEIEKEKKVARYIHYPEKEKKEIEKEGCGICNSRFHNAEEHNDLLMLKEEYVFNQGSLSTKEDVLKILDERIKHPFYVFDANKINKKIIKISMEELIKSRIKIFEELKQEIKSK